MNSQKILKTKYGHPSYILYATNLKNDVRCEQQNLYAKDQHVKMLKKQLIESYDKITLLYKHLDGFYEGYLLTNKIINAFPDNLKMPNSIDVGLGMYYNACFQLKWENITMQVKPAQKRTPEAQFVVTPLYGTLIVYSFLEQRGVQYFRTEGEWPNEILKQYDQLLE